MEIILIISINAIDSIEISMNSSRTRKKPTSKIHMGMQKYQIAKATLERRQYLVSNYITEQYRQRAGYWHERHVDEGKRNRRPENKTTELHLIFGKAVKGIHWGKAGKTGYPHTGERR